MHKIGCSRIAMLYTPLCSHSRSLHPRLSFDAVEQHMLAREACMIRHFLTADLHSSDQHSCSCSCSSGIPPPWNRCCHPCRKDGIRQPPAAQPGQWRGLARCGLRRFRHGGRTARGQQSLEVETGMTLARRFGREGCICGLQQDSDNQLHKRKVYFSFYMNMKACVQCA